MTWEQFIERQEKIMRDLRTEGVIFGRAVSAAHAKYLDRIFVDGEATNGEKIGEYKGTGKVNIPKGLPGGGKTYNSYKEYRKAIGRETRFVNLRLTGLLQNDWRAGLKRKNAREWEVEPKAVRNKNITEAQEKRYKKKIFEPSKDELSHLEKVFNDELTQLFGR